MAMQQVDPENIAAVLRYLAQHFSNHTLATFPDPDQPAYQVYRITGKGDGQEVRELAVSREFFTAAEVPNIVAKLKAHNVAEVLHTTREPKVVLTADGLQKV